MEIEITAYCNICGRTMLVKSLGFGIDQTLGLDLECGHPKSFSLIENDLSALHEHMKHMKEGDEYWERKNRKA